MRFKAEFEVAPVIDLKDHRGVLVHYQEPEVSDEDIGEAPGGDSRPRGRQLTKYEPRPRGWRFAVIALESIAGLGLAKHQDEESSADWRS